MIEQRRANILLALAPLLPVLIYGVAIWVAIPERHGEIISLLWTYMQTSIVLAATIAMLAVATVLLWKIIRRDTAQSLPDMLVSSAKKRWRADFGLGFVVPPMFFALLLTSFNSFKQAIRPGAGFGFDPYLALWDRALFAGVDPWRVTHALFGGPQVAWWINAIYHPWFVPMALGVFLCALMPSRSVLAARYLMSFAAVWILLGSVMAYFMPSAGPVYYARFHPGPDPFYPLIALLQDYHLGLTSAGGLGAVDIQAILLANHETAPLSLGGGISAMPSVHNGLAILFACAAFAVRPWAGWAASAYAFLIWIGSVHLGWHYALDGIVAAVVVLPVWIMSSGIVRWLLGVANATITDRGRDMYPTFAPSVETHPAQP